MQTISTSFIAPSDTKGARIRARASGYVHATGARSHLQIMVAWDHAIGSDANHLAAAQALAARLGWAGLWQGGEAADARGLTFVCAGGQSPSFTIAEAAA